MKIGEAKMELLQTGLHLGKQDLDVPFWLDARNVIFDTHGMHTERGFSPVYISTILFDDQAGMFDSAAGLFDDSGGAITALDIGNNSKITGLLQQFLDTGARQVIVGTGSNLYRYTGGATVSIGSGYTNIVDENEGKLATYWSIVNFENWVLATNGINPVQVDKGAGFAGLTGMLATRAEVIRKIGPYVLIFNTSNGPTMMEWCAENDPEEWDFTVAPDAGRIPVKDLSNPIICAEPLGALGLGVYTRSEMIAVQFQGGTFTFGQRLAQKGIGAASKNSIVPLGGLHYGISQIGVWATDGSGMQVLSGNNITDWLIDNVNWAQQSKIASYLSLSQGVIKWSLPIGGANEPNITLLYNTKTREFGLSNLVFTVGLAASVFNYPLIGRFSGRVDLAESTPNDRGAPIERYAVTKPLDFGDPQIWKYIDLLTVKGKVHSGMGPRCFIRSLVDTKAETLLNTPWDGPFLPEDLFSKFFVRANAPFLQFRFESIATNEDWLLSSFEVWGSASGKDW